MTRRIVPVVTPSQPVPMSRLDMWKWFAILFLAYASWQLKWPLVILALIGFFWCWFWLCERYPRTMLVISGFLRGLLGGGRRW